jgi:hypothetical protein
VIRFFEEVRHDLCRADDDNVLPVEIDVGAPARRVEYFSLELLTTGDRGGPWILLHDDADAADNDLRADFLALDVYGRRAGVIYERLPLSRAELAGARHEGRDCGFPF